MIREADGRYYVSFVVDVPNPQSKETKTAVGIDVGLIDLATIVRSNGQRTKVSNPRFLKRKTRKLIRAQRALTRKKKGSKNREKARISLATQHRKVRESRKDFLHKIALPLVRENQAIAVEDISIEDLMKTRMAQSISDVSWGIFLSLVKEKAEAYLIKEKDHSYDHPHQLQRRTRTPKGPKRIQE